MARGQASGTEQGLAREPHALTGRRAGVQLRAWLPTFELALAALAGALWTMQGGWGWVTGSWPGPWPLGLLGLMVALTVWREGLRAFRLTPFTVPLIAFVATAGVALWAAYDFDLALAKVWLLIAALGLYWAVAHQPDPARLVVSLGFWSLICILLPAYFFMTTDWSTAPTKIPLLTRLGATITASLPDLNAPVMSPNVIGGLLALTLPLAIPLIGLPRRIPALSRFLRTLLAAVGVAGLVLGSLGLLTTVSRGAWLGLFTTAGLWLTWRILARLGHRRRLAVMAALLLLAMITGGAVGWAVLTGRSLPGLPDATSAALRASLLNRLHLFQLGALLARDTPFTGIGLGVFEMHFSIYTLLIHVGYIVYAHNMLLDLIIEQGILAAAAFGVMAATAYSLLLDKRWWRADADPTSPPERATPARGLILEAALASLTAVLLHGLVDSTLYGSRGTLLLWVPFGILAALSRWEMRDEAPAPSPDPCESSPPAKAAKRVRVLARTHLVLVPLLALLGTGIVLRTQGGSGTPLAARWQGAWHANLGAIAQARTELNIYDQRYFSDLTMDEARQQGDLSLALAHFRRAVAFDPENTTARQRLTAIALARGDYDEALAAMQLLWDAGHRDRVTRLLYGDALVAAGRVDEAVDVVQGLMFARTRLQGQAWARYHLGEDAARETYATEAAKRVWE